MRIRIPADLEVEIRLAASRSGRSMNAEIVHRLQRSFADNDAIGYEATTARLEQVLGSFESLVARIPMDDVLDFLEAKDAERAAKARRKVARSV